ncbi:MAG: tetratricopeptide repeat protein, partial [Pyrinomonadaceae bacterium]
ATLKKETSTTKAKAAPASEEDLQEEVELTLTLPMAERVEKLKAFIEAHPASASITRATELLVSAHAALGDERLRAGDTAGGLEQFRMALAESPANVSEKLFNAVLAQLPLNIFLRGQRDAALEMARAIETKFKDDPKRLLALATFYLSTEQPEEAARIAEQAIKVAPDSAAAHRTLGASRHIALRLDDAAAEYARALELDPNLSIARRSLADLRRANGKPEEALSLYREQLKRDPSDKAARSGVVLSLLDLGKRDEAITELDAALKDEPRNLILLVGAAYWFAAHGDNARALALAQSAVSLEPRYTWSYITLARAMIADNHQVDAERVIRTARQYGQFPTLDYELANALAASGLYREAAEALARSFHLKDGQLETQLAGRVPTRAESFTELLAPERRASIFQHAAADTEENARMLKALLAFDTAINQTSVKETDAAAAAQEFVAGKDKMRVYRQLYAASRLLQRGVALPLVLELTDAATGGIEAALDTPTATVATLSDELHTLRSQALSSGTMPILPDVQSNVLSSILRGRIEDIAGWALFNQDKGTEAVTRLRRAASVLPPNTIWLRTALWHLGVALEATGNPQEALNAYIKSYQNGGVQDPVRRAVIEGLYRKVNGSLDGLDTKIGEARSTTISANEQLAPAPSASTVENAAATNNTTTTPTDTSANAPSSSQTAAAPANETIATPSSTASATPAIQPTSEPSKTESKDATPANNANEAEGNYTIQIGSYTDETQAAERAERLRLKGFDSYITKVEIPNRGTWFRIQSGHFKTREEAEEYGTKLKDKGAVLDFIITEINLSTRRRSNNPN